MFKPVSKLCVSLFASALMLSSASVFAATKEIKMLNKGSDGSSMVFEPALATIAPGDSVHFVATDKSHSVESIKDAIPEGATPFAGKPNEDLTVKFDKPGIYGFECKPHFMMGMAGLVVVGKPVNKDAIKTAINASAPNLAKQRLNKLLEQIDAKK